MKSSVSTSSAFCSTLGVQVSRVLSQSLPFNVTVCHDTSSFFGNKEEYATGMHVSCLPNRLERHPTKWSSCVWCVTAKASRGRLRTFRVVRSFSHESKVVNNSHPSDSCLVALVTGLTWHFIRVCWLKKRRGIFVWLRLFDRFNSDGRRVTPHRSLGLLGAFSTSTC